MTKLAYRMYTGSGKCITGTQLLSDYVKALSALLADGWLAVCTCVKTEDQYTK